MNALIAYLFKKCIIALIIVNFETTRNILQKTDLSIRILYTTIYYNTLKYLGSSRAMYLIHGIFDVNAIY